MSKYSLFPAALTEALAKTGMNASSLAGSIGVHRSRISDFADGGSLPKDDTLVSMCGQFPPLIAAQVAKAWVRERIGHALSNAILATKAEDQGSELDRLFAALPTGAADAFRQLIQVALNDEDMRQSIVSLAAFSRPDTTHSQSADQLAPQSAANQEISEDATNAESRSTTATAQELGAPVKIVLLQEHIMQSPEMRVAEPTGVYKTDRKKGS